MKKFILVCLAFPGLLAFVFTLSCKKNEPEAFLSGKVIGNLDKKPISNVFVRIIPDDITVKTDEGGNYSFDGLDVHSVTIEIRNTPDFEDFSQEVNIHEGNNTKDIELITSRQLLKVNKSSLDFGTLENSLPVLIYKTGTTDLEWTFSNEGNDWITADKNSGILKTDTENVMISIDRSGLTLESYSALVTFRSNNGDTARISIIVNHPGTISVLKPVENASVKQAGVLSIRWEDNLAESVKIDLYKGSSFLFNITPSSDDSVFEWTVPATLAVGNNYKICISGTINTTLKSYSGTFTIAEKSKIAVVSPQNTIWSLDNSQTISWTDNLTENIKIELYKGNSLFSTISSDTTSSGSFLWTIPHTLPLAADYKIKISSLAEPAVSAFSGNFSISSASVSVNVYKLSGEMTIDGNWDKPQWSASEIINIDNSLNSTGFIPVAQAKIMYDDENIYVIFRVQDRYVRCITNEINGPVWEDAAAEMFFAPDINAPEKYFNLEVNCGGTPLMFYSTFPRTNFLELAVNDIQNIEIAHSLPQIIDPEITDPVTWTIEYKLPISLIRKYSNLTQPGNGTIWRANFYNCASNNSSPHWLTWGSIKNGVLNFHQPEYFGRLIFQ